MIRLTEHAKEQVATYLMGALAPCGIKSAYIDDNPSNGETSVNVHFHTFKSIRAALDQAVIRGDLSDLIKRLTPPDYVPPPKPKTDAEIAVELRSVAVNSPGERMLCEAVARLLERK